MTHAQAAGERSIVAIARGHAAEIPDRPAFAFLADGETETARYSFAGLDTRARAVAAALQERGLAGERILIAYPSGLEYVEAFLGCLYAGAVAVPSDTPAAAASRTRLRSIRSDCAPAAVLTDVRDDYDELAGLPRLDVAAIPGAAAARWADPGSAPGDLAFLQYTSGSTRTPCGVEVCHGNIVANERLIAAACRHDDQSTFVGWQPLFHDMGLVANVMQPLFLGALCVLMPPLAFLHRPARWLRAVSAYRAHTSGGPNFAYDMCVDQVTEADRAGLDLSSWRVAFNSAEPVREGTLDRFSQAFGPQGFAATAHFPCYGLAEATLLVTDPGKDRPPRVLRADPDQLRAGHVVPAPASAPSGAAASAAAALVSAGRPGIETVVRIVDPATASPVADGGVGEVWIGGGGVARGYWGARPETAGLFGQRLAADPGRVFLRTGDLGCLLDGELFLTGRLKDMIVLRGQNHYPQDLERAAELSCPALRPSAVAAFAVPDDGGERLVLCCELRSYRGHPSVADLGAVLRAGLLRTCGVELRTLVVLRRGGVPKTTSGKLRRQACREAYLAGALPRYGEADLRPATDAAGPDLPPAAALRGPDRAPGEARLAAALLRIVASRLGPEDGTPGDGAPGDGDAGDQAAAGDGALRPDRPLIELGMNSVVALELCHAIRTGYGTEPSLAGILRGASAADLAAEAAAAVAARPAAEPDPASREVPPPADGGPADWLPLTRRQLSIWYEQQLDPDAAAYHLARAVQLSDVSPERLERAVASLVSRHPALRTRFAVRDASPRAAVTADGPALAHIDASGLTETQLASLLRAESQRPFDLTTQRPVRLTVLRRGPRSMVLLLVAHHLIADLWSLVVLLRDLADCYAATAAGPGGADRIAPGAGHAQLVEIESRRAASEQFRLSEEHWRAELDGVPGRLDLPTDGAAPLTRSFAGAGYSFRIPAGLAGRLRAVASAQGGTLFTTLLAGYQLLLHRFTGQDDIAIGTLLAGREDPRFAGTVGYLVNLAPIRSRYRAAEPFSAFLRQAGRAVAGAAEHGWYPCDQVVADLAVERSAAHPPLIQSLFVLHHEQGARNEGFRALALGLPGRLSLGELRMEVLAAERDWSQLDLSLSLAELDGELAGVWEYRTDMFGAATIAALTSAFISLLASAAADPQAPAGELELGPPSGPAAPAPPRPARGLHQLVTAAARRWPAAVAVAAPGQDGRTGHLTYRALHRAAAGLAGRLRALGAGRDQPVAVVAERGPELVVAYLGILYAGCAVLPVDPADPDERIGSLLADSGACLALTHERLLARAASWPVPAVAIDAPARPDPAAPAPAAPAPAAPAPATSAPATPTLAGARAVHPQQAAYVLYTSGSTGAPKGAVVPHDAIVNRILWMQEEYRLAPGDRVLHKTPVTFDVSMWEIFWPLTTGGCLVLAEPGRHRDPRYVLDVLARERVGTAHFVPTMLAPVVAEARRAGGPGPALTRVICSGESLPGSLAAAAIDVLAADVHNLYGPTEAAVDVTAWPCPPGAAGPVPIGWPITGVSCRVLDDRGRPLPPRLPGELYLGGRCVGRGYVSRPALTAASFGPARGAEPGARYYRTGDRARERADGALEFLGRRDDQVKIGGIRVEPGEIEQALRREPGVTDAAVVVRRDARGRDTLIGYVVPAVAAGTEPGQLRARLRRVLPGHLVPAAIVGLDRLPLGPSGKLDRRALAAIAPPSTGPPGGPATGGAAAQPATVVERQLAGLWQAHLGIAGIEADQDFFALGGDSILALRLVGAARDAGLPLTVTDMLQERTIRALAARLEPADRAPSDHGPGDHGPGDAEPPTAPFALCPAAAGTPGLEDAYPISLGQRALLAQQAVNPGYEVYVTSIVAGLPLAGELLAEAVRAAAGRHAYLRSSFDLTSYAEPVQLVHAELAPPLEYVDLRGLPEADREAAIARWLAAERLRRFDTGSGPLVRFAAHDLGTRFRLSVSSFALDGWCDGTVLTEVLTDYAGRLAGQPAALAAPPVGYRDFVAAERAALGSAAQRRFWAAELGGARPARLPRRPPPGRPDDVERRRVVPLDDHVTGQLAARATQLGTGLKQLLLGAHLAVIGELTAQPEIVTGLQFNGRPEATGGDRVIGMFNNIVPLRARLPGGSWADLVRVAAGAEAGLAPYRRYPLAELQRRLGAADLFDTMFVFTHFHAYRMLARAGVQVSGLHASDQTYLPLTAHFNVDAWSGRPRLLLEFDPRQLGPGQVAEIGDRYASALAAIARDPRQPYPAAAPSPGDQPGPAAGPGDLDRLLDRLADLTEAEAALLTRRHQAARAAAAGGGADGTR